MLYAASRFGTPYSALLSKDGNASCFSWHLEDHPAELWPHTSKIKSIHITEAVQVAWLLNPTKFVHDFGLFMRLERWRDRFSAKNCSRLHGETIS